MMKKAEKDVVYLILKGAALRLNSKSGVGVGYGYDGPIEDEVKGVLASVRCINCNQPSLILSLDGAEVVEEDEREMGTETFFICEYYGKCSNCDQDMHTKFLLNEYACSWCYIEAEEMDNCRPYFINGLKHVAKQIGKLYEPSDEETEWEEVLVAQKCRIIVEGKEDFWVLKEFLAKTGLDMGNLLIWGANGINELKACIRQLRALEASFPLVFVADPDTDRESRITELKNAGARDEEIFVWSRRNIDGYLADPKALARTLVVSEGEVRAFYDSTKETDPKRLIALLFMSKGLPAPNWFVKRLIVRNIKKIPKDVKRLSDMITERMS
ncbi:MAG: hypothetical protein WED05_10100 [Candidatus Atabeyarchaeum deiterrae]